MGEDLLICDLAETYHILDYKSLPISLVATLAVGLPDDSRIKRKLCNQDLSITQLLIARIIDDLDLLLWTKTKDAAHNRNKPKSLLKQLMEKKPKDELISFDDPEEYEEYIRNLRG